MCGQVQGLAVFPKGCSEGPWLQEVMLETCQWEEPGRSHQELEETWEDRAGARASRNFPIQPPSFAPPRPSLSSGSASTWSVGFFFLRSWMAA